jgi:hypothetical protein
MVPSAFASTLAIPWCTALADRFRAIQAFEIINVIFAFVYVVVMMGLVWWVHTYDAFDDAAPLETLRMRQAATPAVPATPSTGPSGSTASSQNTAAPAPQVHSMSQYLLENPLRAGAIAMGVAGCTWAWLVIAWGTITGTYYNLPSCNSGAAAATQALSPSGSYFFYDTPRGTGYKMGASFGLYLVAWIYLTFALIWSLYRYFYRAVAAA